MPREWESGKVSGRGGGYPGGVLRISSDGDDERICLGLKFSICGFLGGQENLASIFLVCGSI